MGFSSGRAGGRTTKQASRCPHRPPPAGRGRRQPDRQVDDANLAPGSPRPLGLRRPCSPNDSEAVLRDSGAPGPGPAARVSPWRLGV